MNADRRDGSIEEVCARCYGPVVDTIDSQACVWPCGCAFCGSCCAEADKVRAPVEAEKTCDFCDSAGRCTFACELENKLKEETEALINLKLLQVSLLIEDIRKLRNV